MTFEINGVDVLHRNYSQENRDKQSIQNASMVGEGFSKLVATYKDIISKDESNLSGTEKQIKKDYEDMQESLERVASDLDILKRMILFYQEHYGAKIEDDTWDGKKWTQKDLQRSENILLKYCLGERTDDRIQDPFDKKLRSGDWYYKKIQHLLPDSFLQQIPNTSKAPLYVIAYVLQELGYNERYVQLQDGDIDMTNIEHIDLIYTLQANDPVVFSKDLLRNVLLFQIDNGLQPDGLVGVRFLQKLYYLYNQYKDTKTHGQNQINQQNFSDPTSSPFQDTFSQKNNIQTQDYQESSLGVLGDDVVSTQEKTDFLDPLVNNNTADNQDYDDLDRQKHTPRVLSNGPGSKISIDYKTPSLQPLLQEDQIDEDKAIDEDIEDKDKGNKNINQIDKDRRKIDKSNDKNITVDKNITEQEPTPGTIKEMVCKKYAYRGTESQWKTSRLLEDWKIKFSILAPEDMINLFQKNLIFEEMQNDSFTINIKEFGKQQNYEMFLKHLGYFVYYFGGEKAYQDYKNIIALNKEKNALKTVKFDRKTGKFIVHANYISGVSFEDLYKNNVEYVGIFTQSGWSQRKIFFEKNQGESFTNTQYYLAETKDGKNYYVLKGEYKQARVEIPNK